MGKRNKQLIFIGLVLFLLFGGLMSAEAICYSDPCAPVADDPVSGTLSVNSTSVCEGEPIIVYITGQDNDGLSRFSLYYDDRWDHQNVSGTSTVRTWTVTEDSPGTYTFCGRVTGYKNIDPLPYFWIDNTETADTSPRCVSVNVSCPLPPSCTDECSYSGQTRCYNSERRQVCGNYDSDSCLEWSSSYSCSGSTSCGYGSCDDDERPDWYCSGGECKYSCKNSSSCEEKCECSEGPCCDGCHYKSSTVSCDVEVQTQYGCPWGTSCGVDVGKRTRSRLRYCSGSSTKCTGDWGNWLVWGNWKIADSCSANEVCRVGNSQCQYNSACVQPTYIKHFRKDCYDSDMYWFDSNGIRQEKYQECEDNNSCTIDGCENSACFNDLKCDGTTCEIGSTDYCQNCEHCGDNVCNCEEDVCSCSEDCEFVNLAISILWKEESDEGEWKETLSVATEEEVDFLVVVINDSSEEFDNVFVKLEIPQGIIYKDELRVGGDSFGGDINKSINIGPFPPETEKIITFKGKISSEIAVKTETEIIGTVSAEDQSASDVMRITIEREGKGAAAVGLALKSLAKKWYVWVLFWLAFVILLYWIFRRRKG
jgi:hypothetical protein